MLEAKKGELVAAGVAHPSNMAAWKAVSRDELLRHRSRRTRGTEETVKTISCSCSLSHQPQTHWECHY